MVRSYFSLISQNILWLGFVSDEKSCQPAKIAKVGQAVTGKKTTKV
jgi:hypothetical protein